MVGSGVLLLVGCVDLLQVQCWIMVFLLQLLMLFWFIVVQGLKVGSDVVSVCWLVSIVGMWLQMCLVWVLIFFVLVLICFLMFLLLLLKMFFRVFLVVLVLSLVLVRLIFMLFIVMVIMWSWYFCSWWCWVLLVVIFLLLISSCLFGVIFVCGCLLVEILMLFWVMFLWVLFMVFLIVWLILLVVLVMFLLMVVLGVEDVLLQVISGRYSRVVGSMCSRFMVVFLIGQVVVIFYGVG